MPFSPPDLCSLSLSCKKTSLYMLYTLSSCFQRTLARPIIILTCPLSSIAAPCASYRLPVVSCAGHLLPRLPLILFMQFLRTLDAISQLCFRMLHLPLLHFAHERSSPEELPL